MRRPTIRPCMSCGRMTRPPQVPKNDAPFTISRANGDLCNTCYSTGSGPKWEPKETHDSKPCPRCGIPRVIGGNSAVLCRDCRDVLNRDEQKIWTA